MSEFYFYLKDNGRKVLELPIRKVISINKNTVRKKHINQAM